VRATTVKYNETVSAGAKFSSCAQTMIIDSFLQTLNSNKLNTNFRFCVHMDNWMSALQVTDIFKIIISKL